MVESSLSCDWWSETESRLRLLRGHEAGRICRLNNFLNDLQCRLSRDESPFSSSFTIGVTLLLLEICLMLLGEACSHSWLDRFKLRAVTLFSLPYKLLLSKTWRKSVTFGVFTLILDFETSREGVNMCGWEEKVLAVASAGA